ncbi:hypothetical protein H6G65_18535 [Microcystis elabens FACHB-917]|nr:hypothetical protein [Microcystis elabens FACHB-917]
MTLFTKALKATLIASMPAIISAQPAMAQALPDASFAEGCNGGAFSVSGTVQDFLNFSKNGEKGCQVIDKLYTFEKDAFASFDAENTLLQIANSTFNPLSHIIKLSNASGFQPGPYSFNYGISVVSSSPLYIADWFASAEPVDPFASSYKLITDTDLTGPLSVVFPPNSITTKLPFPGQPTSVKFTNLLTVDEGSTGPNGFTNTITQATPMNQVPGPLPILGAATAFGFSRKLRARIKALA